MRILNLDEGFMPFGKNNRNLLFKSFDFPSKCEPHIKIQPFNRDHVTITCRVQSGNDIIRILLANDALQRMGVERIYLFIPYLPFARQDRVMVPGEPLSIKVMAQMINSCNFHRVTLYDPHSDVAPALINNSKVITNSLLVDRVLMERQKNDHLIVSPDAGAYKKIFKVCQDVQYQGEIICCNKLRDVSNGTIRSLTVSHDNLEGKDVFIIDDICDGGGTFNLLGEVLKEKGAGAVNLIVSHAIISKGIDAIRHVDHVYTTDSFATFPHSNKLTQYEMISILPEDETSFS